MPTTATKTNLIHTDTIEEVKQRADIVDVISKHVTLSKRGKDYVGLCPFHEGKTPNFSVSPSKRLYYCFDCNADGNAIKFLMEVGKRSFTDAVLELAGQYGVPVRWEDGKIPCCLALHHYQRIENSPVGLINSLSYLEEKHWQHLIDEGFSLKQIVSWQREGLESLTEQQAYERGFRIKTKDGYKSGSGLYLPFNSHFGQLRLDTPLERENGDKAKYLTPCGKLSLAAIPNGCKVVTEGMKDARAGTVHGQIPTGAIAGVSHYRRALPHLAGYTILFDADGWTNPSVFSHLFHAGKWLNGKVQLLPRIEGQPKAGLCEYFKVGYTAEDYKKLIDSAMKPEALLLEWGNHFKDIPAIKLDRAIHVAFRLAAEYLCDVQQEQLLNSIKAATKLSSKTLRAQLEKEQAKVLKKRRKQLEKNIQHTLPSEPDPRQLFKQSILERRAAALLDSGVLLDLISVLLKKIGAVGIDEHVKLALASCLGTLRLDRKRSMPVLFTGSSGIGKSMVLDILETLLPKGKAIRVSGVSDAVLKRIGDRWQGAILLIDEFSTWASSEVVLSTLKEIITRGKASFEIVERKSEHGQHEICHHDVTGPIGLAACATDATLSSIFKDTEEEIRGRFNELPLREDESYIRQIAFAAFDGLEPKSIVEAFPRIAALIHRAIEIAVGRQVPTIDPLLHAALKQHIRPDRPLFPRLMKRLKILMENTAALLGKEVVDLEVYAIVFPLISQVFRRNLTYANDAVQDNFVRFARNLKNMGGGYLPFKMAKVQEHLSASKATAYRWRDKWESLGWITEGEGRGFWNITGIGAQLLELLTSGKDSGLPDILPEVETVAATMVSMSLGKSHLCLTYPNPLNSHRYQGLSDFMAFLKSHKSLTKISGVNEDETTPIQELEEDLEGLKSQKSHLQEENGGQKNSSPSFNITGTKSLCGLVESLEECSKNYPTPPENSENNEKNPPQRRQEIVAVGAEANSQVETTVRQPETTVRKTETEQVEPDYSTFPHRSSNNIQACVKLASRIRLQLLGAEDKEELAAIIGEHGENQVNWVWRSLLTNGEREKVRAIAQTFQLSLLATAPNTEAVQASLAHSLMTAGEKVAQPAESDSLPQSNEYAQVDWEGSKFHGVKGKVVRRSKDEVELLLEGVNYNPCFPVERVRFLKDCLETEPS